MNFKQKCLYCGKPDGGLKYGCDCANHGWTDLYRVIDIDMEFFINRQRIAESFHHYSFDHPEGLLQYKGLPYHHILPNIGYAPGLTPLHELGSLSIHQECNIYLKDEGANPSGCFKDRETALCLLNSQFNNLNSAVIYSSGNAAASAAHFAESSGQQLVTFVAGDTYPEKINYIRDHGSDVIVIGNDQTNFEDGYQLFSAMANNNIFSDHKFDNWSVRNPFRVQGDKTIAVEIIQQLSGNRKQPAVPDYVIVPTANGTCLTGIWKGFKELERAGVIDKQPQMIPVGIKNANPVCKAVRLRKTSEPVRCNLSDVAPNDEDVGSIIVAEEGYDSIEAARSVIESGGFEIELHASNIQRALVDFLKHEAPLAREHGILPEPASLTSLAAIDTMREERKLSPTDVVIAVSTGDGIKAEHMILSLLDSRPILQDTVNEIIAAKKSTSNHQRRIKGRKIAAEPNLDALVQSFYQLQTQLA